MIKKIIKVAVRTLPLLARYPAQFVYVPVWWSSIKPDSNLLTEERPWLAFTAVEFLEKIITKDMRVYEYGSGGSTLFFARRAKEVISVEHNRRWHEKVRNEILSKNIQNCRLLLVEPLPFKEIANFDVSDPDAYLADDGNYRNVSFERYAKSIEMYQDEYFDVVVIDGRSRPSCFKHALKKVKKNGYMILDNSERFHYRYIVERLSSPSWRKSRFYGLVPGLYHFSETCIWQRAE